MKLFAPTALTIFMLGVVVSPAQSQSIYTDIASGIAKQGMAEAEKLLDEAPSLLGDAFERAEQGQAYESREYCRGALQAVVNVGAIVANITSFSKVWTFEDDRGPVGRFKIMLNGEQIHTEIYCDENLMLASALEWGTGSESPEEVVMNSFSALAGTMLIMKLQGVFEEAAEIAAEAEEINERLSSESAPRSESTGDEDVQAAKEAASREAEEAAILALLDAAVAEAVGEPALSGGQRQGIIEAVSRNWNKSIVLGLENYERFIVVLEVSVAPNGSIIRDSIKPVEPADPTGDFLIAYDAARRSVLRAEVIPLPYGFFPNGVRLVLTFDPALNEVGFN